MVNKREKTRSLVYQMKEDIFRQEAALAELEHEEESSTAKVPGTTAITLPKYCHHSTGTVYDEPAGILRMARWLEERAVMLDRKNLSLSSPITPAPLHSKTCHVSAVSPTRSRHNRQNTRPPDIDGLTSSPAASRSPIQQLFRDKMEGLESGSWAGSSLIVKTESSGSDLAETNHESPDSLAISSEELNTIAVSDAISSMFIPSPNGLVKILNAADNEKHLKSEPADHEGQMNKSDSVEHKPLADATQRNENAVVSADTAAAESHVVLGIDDISKTNETHDDLKAITSHRDKVIKSREDDRKKMGTRDSENDESVKVRAKPGSQSVDRKGRGTVKKDALKEKDTEVKPQIQTRRRMSKEQFDMEKVNHVTEELNSSLSQKTGVPRSAKKTRASDQLSDDSDILMKQPLAAKSENLKRAGSSLRGRPSNDKSRKNHKICTEVTSGSKSDSSLKRDLPQDEQHKAAADTDKGQKVPLEDSSASNQKSAVDFSAQQILNSNYEATDSTSLTRHASSDSETASKPYFHSDNFRLVEVNSSKSNDEQSQSTICAQSVKFEAIHSHESITLDPTHAGNAASVTDTQVVDSDNTSRPTPVDSLKHKESKKLLDIRDTLLHVTPESQSESRKKPTPSSRSRPKNRPGMHGGDTANELDKDSEKDFVAKGSVKKSAGRPRRRINSIDVDSVTAREHSELIVIEDDDDDDIDDASQNKKALLTFDNKEDTVSRISRKKVMTDGVDVAKELDKDSEKNDAAKVGVKKSAGRPRKRISTVSVDAVITRENSESHVIKDDDNGDYDNDDVSRNKKSLLALDNEKDTTTLMSTNKVMTYLPVSVSSESTPASATTDNHLESVGSLLANDLNVDTSALLITSTVKSDVIDVDNLHTSITSTANEPVKSPRNAPCILSASDISLSDLSRTKTGFYSVNTATTLLAKQVWKSGLNDVGLQPSVLEKTSTASSRKRAAHLMAGCRRRTVGVKRPAPTVEESASDQHMLIRDANDQYDQPPTSEHRSFIQTYADVDNSAGTKSSYPHTTKHVPFVLTDSNVSRSTDTLAESSDRFFPVTPLVDITAKSISRLSSSGSEEAVKKNTPQNLSPVVVEDSLRKDTKTLLNERPQLLRFNSIGSGFSGSLLSSAESKPLTSAPVVTDSRRESLRTELLRKFLPSQLIVSDSIKRRVQDGLQLLSSIRSAPTICSHTRQKLAEYLNQSREEATHERLPLRPIDDSRDQSATSLRRQLPVRAHRRIYSEWEYVSGEEFTSPVSDVESNSDSDYSVDIDDLAVSDSSLKSSRSLVRTNREHRISTVHD